MCSHSALASHAYAYGSPLSPSIRAAVEISPPFLLPNPAALKPKPLSSAILRRRFPPLGAVKRPDAPSPSSGEVPSSYDFLELKRELESEERGGDGSDDGDGEVLALPGVSGREIADSSEEDEEERSGRVSRRRMSASGRQMVRRSTLLAKQVISVRSACSIGFVSQIWVDSAAWLVAVIEVRPSILSGECKKFLLEDVSQVGDVILVEDESVAEYDINMFGLDSLVGYNVVTMDRHKVGKVRDFSFNINSGAVESLELDPFGVSIIPSSIVSTYSLLVEDVLEIRPDKIVVHDGAISRLQRLSKGLWDTQSSRYSGVELEFSAFQQSSVKDAGSRRASTRKRRARSRLNELDDDWDLPMEY